MGIPEDTALEGDDRGGAAVLRNASTASDSSSTTTRRLRAVFGSPRSGSALVTPLPWQQDTLDLGLELLPNGQLAFKEVIITCGRQSGKSWVALAVALHRLIAWRHPPQVVAWSARSGKHARKKLLDTFLARLQASPLGVAVKETRRSQGGEAPVFPRGSRLDVIASRGERAREVSRPRHPRRPGIRPS
jgi:hypothetical protein